MLPSQTAQLQNPEPIVQPQKNEPEEAIGDDDILGEITTAAKPSADTKTDEDGQVIAQPEPAKPVDPVISKAEAKSKVMAFMKFRDFVQARAFALAGGDINRAKEFQMEDWEFEMLCEAYETQVQLIGKIPDWLYIAVTESLILGRRAKMIWDMRKLKKENARQAEELMRLKMEMARREGMQQANSLNVEPTETKQPTAVPIPDRKDFKKYWEIEVEDGVPFFKTNKNGAYVPKDKREKVEITASTYPFLVKHNAQDIIDQING